jgi:lycopene beta-cyclase
VAVVEARSAYTNDRTWSFFLDNKAPFPHLDIVRKKWFQWKFSSHCAETIQSSERFSYATIQSDDFYRKALLAINQDCRQTIFLSATVGTVVQLPGEEWYSIETSSGPLRARVVIDTRHIPAEQMLRQASYFQIFYGYEIAVDHDLFDESCADLMTGMITRENGMDFTYLLPFSKRAALFEYTVFSSQYFQPQVLERYVVDCLRLRFPGVKYDVQRKESAVLPMGPVCSEVQESSSYFRFGMGAGHLRESSGFGFLRLLDLAERAVDNLETSGELYFSTNGRSISHALDRMFVRTISRYPKYMPAIFMGIAKKTSAEEFGRFMNDSSSLYDILKIIYAVPKAPFFRELLHP